MVKKTLKETQNTSSKVESQVGVKLWQSSSSSRKTPSILMCPPDHFNVIYNINAYMDCQATNVDTNKAAQQWCNLRDKITECGGQVETIAHHPDWPDQVFTANAGSIIDDTVWVSEFKDPERQGETPLFADWFKKHGYAVRSVNGQHDGDYLPFEGAGDAHLVGNTFFAGYGFRTDIRAYDQIVKHHEKLEVIPLQLVHEFHYHLDTCFVPFNRYTGLWCPHAFSDQSQAVLRSEMDRLIEVPIEEAQQLACNAVVIGENIILAAGNNKTKAAIEEAGFNAHLVDVSEFIKAGGACRCLTLVL